MSLWFNYYWNSKGAGIYRWLNESVDGEYSKIADYKRQVPSGPTLVGLDISINNQNVSTIDLESKQADIRDYSSSGLDSSSNVTNASRYPDYLSIYKVLKKFYLGECTVRHIGLADLDPHHSTQDNYRFRWMKSVLTNSLDSYDLTISEGFDIFRSHSYYLKDSLFLLDIFKKHPSIAVFHDFGRFQGSAAVLPYCLRMYFIYVDSLSGEYEGSSLDIRFLAGYVPFYHHVLYKECHSQKVVNVEYNTPKPLTHWEGFEKFRDRGISISSLEDLVKVGKCSEDDVIFTVNMLLAHSHKIALQPLMNAVTNALAHHEVSFFCQLQARFPLEPCS